MESENKRLKVLIVILLLTLLLVGGYLTYLLYFKENKEVVSNNVEVISEETYTYEQMAGVYTFKSESPLAEDDQAYLGATLELFANGVFKYSQSIHAPMGQVGNYIIEGNKIKLNYLFGTNSGVGFTYLSGSKILTINNENSIYDGNIKYGIYEAKGTLTRNNQIKAIDDLDNYFKSNLYMSTFELN